MDDVATWSGSQLGLKDLGRTKNQHFGPRLKNLLQQKTKLTN